MFHDPIQQSSFKANVFPGFFALDPFVLQNFCALREEFFVKRRVFNELRLVYVRRRHVRFFFHNIFTQSTPNGSVAATKIKHRNWTMESCNLFRLWRVPWMYLYFSSLRISWAIRLNSAVTGDFRSSLTIGMPRSPPSRVAISIGISPSSGTRNR